MLKQNVHKMEIEGKQPIVIVDTKSYSLFELENLTEFEKMITRCRIWCIIRN